MAETIYQSPLGPMRIREAYGHITHLDWGAAVGDDLPAGDDANGQVPQQVPQRTPHADVPRGDDTPLLNRAVHQLNAYFFCGLRAFDLPVAPAGTPFQQAVWQQMQAIPYGEARTYGEIARWLRSAARAVGVACGRNPIPIIIPCHRVVAAGGLGGFSGAGGVETKHWLLELEGWPAQRQPTLFDTPKKSSDAVSLSVH